jgi:DNA-binding CsgD family transcriptional regulator
VAAAFTTEAIDIWGGPEAVGAFPLDEPIVASETPNFAVRCAGNRYFVEVLQPRGLFDGIAVSVARHASLMGYVAFNRHVSAGPIGACEVDAMRMLGPHFRRAATISNLLDMKAVEAASFASVLDSLSFGVVLVEGDARIVHANAAAARMLVSGSPIQTLKGRLSLQVPAAQAALRGGIEKAAQADPADGAASAAIPSRGPREEPFVLHILPLRLTTLSRALPPRVAAAVFIAPSTGAVQVPSDALALLYGLTPAETRILELISSGRTQAQIGAKLGIAASTVKTHVLRLLDKTGCERQLDLAKLAAGLSSPA